TAPQRHLPILIGSNVIGFSSRSAGTAEGDARLAAAGVRLIRFDMLWSQVERRRGGFDFSALDARVSAAQAAGLEVLAILDYGNPLYSSRGAVASTTPLAGGVPPFGVGQADFYPPDDPADFGRYAGAVAAHFRGQVLAYEIWNEENEGWRFWPPHEDAAAYAALLRAAHKAVKAADPGATVLFGGVFFPAVPPGLPGTAGDTFLDQGYAADPQLGSSFDAVAYHPYPYPFTSPEYDAPVRGSVPHAGDAMAAVLARHGNAGRPLWITELGWPTQSGYGVSPQKQAEYLVRGAALSAAAGLRAFTWYTYGDTADPTGHNQEAAFGLLDAQGRPKPAYTALDTFTRTLDGTVAAAVRAEVSGADHAVAFSASNRRVTVLWNSPEGPATDQGTEPAAPKDTVAAVPIA